MNLLLIASHAIAEYDDIRMFTDMGVDVFAPGGYEVPSAPGSPLRPALPDSPHHPELVAACNEQRERHGSEPIDGRGEAFDWAKADLHPDVLDWADVIVLHHYPERWLEPQWPKLRDKRVIWRTCGQSYGPIEELLEPLHDDGLQVVRYSPKEAPFFRSIGAFAGEDALIRFGKYPSDYGPWIGDETVVGNVTQDMIARNESTGFEWYLAATQGLPTKPAGLNSQYLPGGTGTLDYAAMLDYLRHIRTYLYTGTIPASYTLGLIEAMLSGVPVVSCPPERFGWAAGLFEGHEITRSHGDLESARVMARRWLSFPTGDEDLVYASNFMRDRALDLFGIEQVSAQWAEFLGAGHPVVARELVAA